MSEDDRRRVEENTGEDTVHFVVPNNLFQFDPTSWSGANQVFYLGSLNVGMNLQALDWFIDNVWNDLTIERPDIKLIVAGRNPSRELISDLSDKGIAVIANPESLTDLFASAKLSIVPAVSGSGGKIKVCESLAHGVPVLTTSHGVVGQPKSIIECCLVSDDPESWKSNIKEVIEKQDRSTNTRIKQVGFALNATYFGNTVRTVGEFVLGEIAKK